MLRRANEIMLDLNYETICETIKGLKLLLEFSKLKIDAENKISTRILSPYSAISNGVVCDIDDWKLELLSHIFSKGVKKISCDSVEDGEIVLSQLEKVDCDILEHYLDIFYDQITSLGLDADHEMMLDFFGTIGMKVLHLEIPFISGTTNVTHNFNEYIPQLISNHFGLSEDLYISTYIDKNNQKDCVDAFIYYIECGSSDFANYIDSDNIYIDFMDLVRSELLCYS